jgi:mono/diheme cytochrome c family protein
MIYILLALAAQESGEALYRQHCASCHGAKGEGGKDYPEPLVGDRTLDKLAVYIDKKMPEGKPEALDAKQSAAVARFIFDAFYSKAPKPAATRPA